MQAKLSSKRRGLIQAGCISLSGSGAALEVDGQLETVQVSLVAHIADLADLARLDELGDLVDDGLDGRRGIGISVDLNAVVPL